MYRNANDDESEWGHKLNGTEGVIVEWTSFYIPKHEDKFALGTLLWSLLQCAKQCK